MSHPDIKYFQKELFSKGKPILEKKLISGNTRPVCSRYNKHLKKLFVN